MKDSIWITCYVLLAVAVTFEIVQWLNFGDYVWWSFWIGLFATIGGAILQVWYLVQGQNEWVHVIIQYVIVAACIISNIMTIFCFINWKMWLAPKLYNFEVWSECRDLKKVVDKFDDVIDGMKKGYVTANNGKRNLSLENISEDVEILKNNTAEINEETKPAKKSFLSISFRCLVSRIFAVLGVVAPLAAVTCAVVFAVVL